jgi:hypothetical protein
LKTTASFSGALRAICWAVLARWSGLGAFMAGDYMDRGRPSTTIAIHPASVPFGDKQE